MLIRYLAYTAFAVLAIIPSAQAQDVILKVTPAGTWEVTHNTHAECVTYLNKGRWPQEIAKQLCTKTDNGRKVPKDFHTHSVCALRKKELKALYGYGWDDAGIMKGCVDTGNDTKPRSFWKVGQIKAQE